MNTGLGFAGFVAMLVFRAVPFVTALLTRLPVEGVRAGGRIREITTKLSMRLIESGTVNERGRDIMSILMKAERDAASAAGSEKGTKRLGLTSQQIVDNVSVVVGVLLEEHVADG